PKRERPISLRNDAADARTPRDDQYHFAAPDCTSPASPAAIARYWRATAPRSGSIPCAFPPAAPANGGWPARPLQTPAGPKADFHHPRDAASGEYWPRPPLAKTPRSIADVAVRPG